MVRRKRAPKLTSAGKAAYPITRAWAQALYDRIPDIDGLIYESHQLPGDCIVLFQRANPKTFVTLGVARPVNKGHVRALLKAEARGVTPSSTSATCAIRRPLSLFNR